MYCLSRLQRLAEKEQREAEKKHRETEKEAQKAEKEAQKAEKQAEKDQQRQEREQQRQEKELQRQEKEVSAHSEFLIAQWGISLVCLSIQHSKFIPSWKGSRSMQVFNLLHCSQELPGTGIRGQINE